MMTTKYDEYYWTERYQNGQTGWDAGSATAPLTAYVDQLTDKTTKILIPGGGNSYEAEYLHQQGFTQVHVLDISPLPLQNFKHRVPTFTPEHIIEQDFFAHHGQYDLILEQTFFSTFPPSMRPQYAQHMHKLLKVGGKLVGVLFQDALFQDHPPFGGYKDDYLPVFKGLFAINYFETCYNSIPPRAGRELFIHMTKTA